MIDLTDLLTRSIATETPASIKARMAADLTAGVDPSDPTYTDLTGGGWTNDLLGAYAIEMDRLYDRLLLMVMRAIAATSDGPALDAWAAAVGLERKDAAFAAGDVEFTGAAGTEISTGAQVSTLQTSPDAEPVTFEVTASGVIVSGTVVLPVRAVEAGARGNVPAGSVTEPGTGLAGVTVTNPDGITGGADVESDEELILAVLRKLAGAAGGGNLAWYEEQCLRHPGVGFVTVTPNWDGEGTVLCTVTDVDNNPCPPPLLDALKARLDPEPVESDGGGLAPVGAAVTVATPTEARVAAAARVVLAPGYTIDGAGGTIAVQDAIDVAVAAYINRLAPGSDVVLLRYMAAVVSVPGVVDVPAATLNGVAANLAIDGDEVAALDGAVTLST